MRYSFEGYVIDTDRRELRRSDAVIAVQPQVFDLLEYLIRKRDRVVTRDDLLAHVWNGRVVSESTIASRINAARSAIGDDGESQRLIRTLQRKGLRFIGEVREEDGAQTSNAATPLIASIGGNASNAKALWRRISPYRGLAAMEERDSAYFFGRSEKTIEVLNVLAAEPDRLPLLLGNSGVGKSSLAQAGVLTSLKRQVWPQDADGHRLWPRSLADSQHWCYLRLRPGTQPVAALVETVLDCWHLDHGARETSRLNTDWAGKLIGGKTALNELLEQTEQRIADLQRAAPAGFFLYVDQGEELYVRAEERQRRRFAELIAQAVGDGHLHAIMSLRADFFGELQKDESLFEIHRLVNVPPLREAELRDVVSRPAALLSACFETDHLAADIARRTAEESVKDSCALPLLSYLLDDMWSKMAQRGDGVLRLSSQSIELGGVLVDRADAFLSAHPNSEAMLRRICTLKLATVREGEEPTRRRAPRSDFTDKEWRLVSDLVDHPYRLLVIAAPDSGEPFAEVAHEAIFRHWDRLRSWIASEREFLAWRSGLETARRAWQAAADDSKNDALLMGLALAQAQNWLELRRDDIAAADREFILRSRMATQQRRRRMQTLVGVLALGFVAALSAWRYQSELLEQINWFTTMRPYMLANFRPYVLTSAAERALTPLAKFHECAKDCPEMIVIPAGKFTMGSPATEHGRYDDESPQHEVTIAKPFAVSKFDVTFAEWDACVSVGGCPQANDYGYGRGTQPVIDLSWNDVQKYLVWLSEMTGRTYRLLTEAEWEYAARAGTTTAYYWGDEIADGSGTPLCNGCGNELSKRKPSPVGSFKPNAFGLYDMAGNVWQWVEDCYHPDYTAAPADGSAWIQGGDCSIRVVRGGAYNGSPRPTRLAVRLRQSTMSRIAIFGFRVARTLDQ